MENTEVFLFIFHLSDLQNLENYKTIRESFTIFGYA